MTPMQSVLIIEDSAEDRFFLRRTIARAFPACKIRTCPYAAEALEFLNGPDSVGLDVIFVDINLPRMDGFEFADLYQERYPELRSRIRMYMLSGSINPEDRLRAERHPAISGFFEKPLPSGALSAV